VIQTDDRPKQAC